MGLRAHMMDNLTQEGRCSYLKNEWALTLKRGEERVSRQREQPVQRGEHGEYSGQEESW